MEWGVAMAIGLSFFLFYALYLGYHANWSRFFWIPRSLRRNSITTSRISQNSGPETSKDSHRSP